MKRHPPAVPEEGVTTFVAHHHRRALPPEVPESLLHLLSAWRRALRREGVLGMTAARDGGAGFGNVSARLPAPLGGFVISGTRTQDRPDLDASGYARILGWSADANEVHSEGEVAPSGHALTHAALYDASPAIGCVLHGHCPPVVAAAGPLCLPTIAADVAYGTPAMAEEMRRLWRSTPLPQRLVLVMGGHGDGVIAIGANAEEAGQALLLVLDAARRLGPAPGSSSS